MTRGLFRPPSRREWRAWRCSAGADSRALAVALGHLTAAAARRVRHQHDLMVVGRYVHRSVPGAALGVPPMPQTVCYRYCECGKLTAEILPGEVPLLALLGVSTSEFRNAFAEWAETLPEQEQAG